jgi:hypothetical protein
LSFVVLADSSSLSDGTSATLIAPAITPSGQYQNVFFTSAAVDGALLTVDSGAGAGTVTPQALLMHKNAFAFVSVPLNNPEPGMGALVTEVTDPETKISISMVRAFDGVYRKEINRFDVLYDFAKLYGEMACAIEG